MHAEGELGIRTVMLALLAPVDAAWSRVDLPRLATVPSPGFLRSAACSNPARTAWSRNEHQHLRAHSDFSSATNVVSPKVCIVWYKRDLRMDDHPGLVAAASSGYDAVIPLFVFDPVLFRGCSPELPHALVEAVLDLKSSLRSAGSDLVIRTGKAEEVLVGLCQQFTVSHVFTEEEIEENLQKLLLSTSTALSGYVPSLKKWRVSLYWNQAVEFLPDNYNAFKVMHSRASCPLDAPDSLPSLPNDLSRGLVPSVSEVQGLYVIDRPGSAKQRLSQLLETQQRGAFKLARSYLSWFTGTKNRASESSRLKKRKLILGRGATGAADTLACYLNFPEWTGKKDWRMLMARVLKEKGNVFRPVFGTALSIGTISVRRLHQQAISRFSSTWFASEVVEAAMNEVKLIDWYRLLALKSQLQGVQRGWQVKIWRWRGFLIQYTSSGVRGRPVLLVHGFGAFWEHYRDNIKQLSQHGNQVWALTMLGFGRSEKPSIFYTDLLLAELIRDFIVEVIGEPSVLVGNSLGGYITSLVSALWPDLVRSLILLNSAGIVAPNYVNTPKSVERSRIPRASLQLLLFVLQQQCAPVFKRCYPANPGRVDKWILSEAMRASYDPGATTVLGSMFYLRVPLPLNFLLDCYKGRTLVIQGILDPLQDAFKKAMKLQACSRNVTVRILDAGHCPHDEVPEDVNRLILDWLKDDTISHADPPTVARETEAVDKVS